MRSPLQICAGALWPLAVVIEEMQIGDACAAAHRSSRTDFMASTVSNVSVTEMVLIYCGKGDDVGRRSVLHPQYNFHQ
jgi:hypothetical protein